METGAERLAARREWLAQAARAEAREPGGARRILAEHDELMAAQGHGPRLDRNDVDAVEFIVGIVKNLAHDEGESSPPLPRCRCVTRPIPETLTPEQELYAVRMRAEHYRPAEIARTLGVSEAFLRDRLAELGIYAPAHALAHLKGRRAA